MRFLTSLIIILAPLAFQLGCSADNPQSEFAFAVASTRSGPPGAYIRLHVAGSLDAPSYWRETVGVALVDIALVEPNSWVIEGEGIVPANLKERIRAFLPAGGPDKVLFRIRIPRGTAAPTVSHAIQQIVAFASESDIGPVFLDPEPEPDFNPGWSAIVSSDQ